MTTPAPRRSALGARFMALIGLVLLFLSAVLMDISHGLFSADDFANRVAASLGDERVSSFVAAKITDVVIDQRPDLTAIRPLLVGTADGLVGSAPFRAVARTALKAAHRAFFSRTGEDVLLSVPDVGVLVQSALGGMNPELAAKIPKRLETVVAKLPDSKLGATLVLVRRTLNQIAWLQRGLFLLSLGSHHRWHPRAPASPRRADAGRGRPRGAGAAPRARDPGRAAGGAPRDA